MNRAILISVCAAILGIFVWLARHSAHPIQDMCEKACYPNPVDRVVGKQCFCKADIVIREVTDEVPGR
jgi:hypothetical protein